MHLHFVLPGPLTARTGGTIYDRRIALSLRRRGHGVVVHELAGDYPTPDASARASAQRALASIRTGALVVVDGLALGALPALAQRERERLALVALVHHPLCDEIGLSERLIRQLARTERDALACVRGVITTSRFTLARLRELEFLPTGLELVASVEPGSDPMPLSGEHGVDECFRFVSVGSLTPRKAHADAFAALVRVADLDWRWTIIGREDMDPGTAAALRAAVRSSEVADRVAFAGELDEEQRSAIVGSAHALLHPSRYEGYGMVITEAIAHGLPVIASTGGALATTVPAGAGLAFEPGDVAALERVLRSVMTEPDVYRALRASALAARGELRDWEHASLEFEWALGRLACATEHDSASNEHE